MWFPSNYLIARALKRHHEFFGDDFAISHSTRPENSTTLDVAAADIWKRLVDIFLVDENGRRPCFGAVQRAQTDPRWRDNALFISNSTVTTAPSWAQSPGRVDGA